MNKITYTFTAKIWLYPGNSAWHFLTISQPLASEIKNNHSFFHRGFGSIPITVTISTKTWNTSIFPDSKTDSYLLPLKAQIRKSLNLKAGDSTSVKLEISSS